MADQTPKPTPRATTMSSPTPNPYGGFKGGQTTTVVGDETAKFIYNSTDAKRKELAILLKNAGYDVPTTGKKSTTIALADAFIMASQKNATENARLGITKSTEDYLKEHKQPAGTDAQGRPGQQRVTNVLSPTEATAEINGVFQKLLGRDATTAEMKTFKAELSKAEKANPTVTRYSTVGGVTTADTTGGIDRQQFLTDLINKNAKLGAELEKSKTTDPAVIQREKDKAIFDKKVAALAGDEAKIAELEATTAYGKDLANLRGRISAIATQAGSSVSADEINTIAKEALDKSIDKDPYTLNDFINSKLRFGVDKTGVFKGAAGETVDALSRVAAANGLDLQKAFGAQLPDWLSAINKGESVDTYKRLIRDVAKIGMPEKVAKLIDQGVDLSTIYAPYKNIMANTLEISPESISLNDPTLRSAITAENEVPLYEFERALRKDNRWQYTNQAREEVSQGVQKVLQDFGFMG